MLTEPSPDVFFRGFGDSSLDFDLLFWTDRPRLREVTESKVNYRIYQALADNHITIPFPQRDLWVRQLPRSDGDA